MTQPILTSALEKYARAQYHFDALLGEVDSFFDPKHYKTRPETNADMTKYRFYIEFERPMPSREWGLVFGDGVHNLRSALDHCVYAIGVEENNGVEPPPGVKDLQFPITEDRAKWDGQAWRLKTLSGPAQAAIKRLQPHGHGDEFFVRPLGALSEFDNADKHRSIRVLASVVTEMDGLLSGLDPGPGYELVWHGGALEDGAPFLTLTLPRPNPNVKMGNKLTVLPAVPHIRADGSRTSLLLRMCIDAMNEAATKVMYELAPFL